MNNAEVGNILGEVRMVARGRWLNLRKGMEEGQTMTVTPSL